MKRIIMLIAALSMLVVGVSLAGESADHAALGGYCPVAYVAAGKAVKGNPEISLDFAGDHYVFANAKAKEMFESDPSAYHVAYDGYCATAVSMGKKLDSDPTLFTAKDGETYLFSSADAKKMFDAKPAAVVAKADEQWATINPALGGYCPVAYVAASKPVKGDAKLAVDFGGRRYYLANDMAKKMFDADPAKYTVAYDGHCATAISMGKKFDSDPTIFTVQDGVTYLFSSQMAKKMFDEKPTEVVTKADEQWASLN